MAKLFQKLILIFASLVLFSLLIKLSAHLGWSTKATQKMFDFQPVSQKPTQVQKILAKFKKPSRVEVEVFTQKYSDEISDIKQIKTPLDKDSSFYIQMQLFSDDTDDGSPLIMQLKFKSIKNNSLLSEESYNL